MIVLKKKQTEATDHSIERLALSIREAAKAVGVSERTIWALHKKGVLKTVRLGGRVLISTAVLKAYLNGEE